ncbi:MAG: NAD-dependent epimerase/dehydratase family protein [Myxococcota bacterium]
MTTLVTGASGHLGANLIRALRSRGRAVRVLLHRDRRAIEGCDVEVVEGSVTNPEDVRRACEGVDVVHHLAGIIALDRRSEARMEAVNVDGTTHVVEACLEAGVRRLVHVSSIHALVPPPGGGPMDESRPLALGAEHMAYDRTKARAEVAVLGGVSRGLDAVVLEPTALLGPHDHKPSRMGETLLMIARGRMPGLVHAAFDWVDARDVAAAALAAEERGEAGERYIVSGHRAAMVDLARVVATRAGRRPPRLVAPMWLARGVAPVAEAASRLARRRPLVTPDSLRVLESFSDVRGDRARRELGHAPRPLEETLRDTVDWFLEAGLLRRRRAS